MATSRPLTVLPDQELLLAGDIETLCSPYTDAATRRVAMANLLAHMTALAADKPARRSICRAAEAASFRIGVNQ